MATRELLHGDENSQPHRIKFDLLGAMQPKYKIDTLQKMYFVIDSIQELFDATAPDFTPHYATLKQRADFAANAVLPEDKIVKLGNL